MLSNSSRQLEKVFTLACKRACSSKSKVLIPGQEFSISKCFTQDEVLHFLHATGDANPLHVDAAAVQAAGLSSPPWRPLLPGILMASLFPAIIGSHFPGALYASQTLSFRSPALVGDVLHAHVTVGKCSGRRITFATQCVHAHTGRVLVDGTALALLPSSQE
ncbi:HotDog domain-containing protein [Dunaliella salina]|uniref:HotDog domain-containing protein n=1 Tax=Dunaliella salina TaxID=3046 RepID=A0ABQ7H4R6_DUNSA|nr:HotDog domain-containing protein [Dunaliella salina]|eukprot:KAF5841853.1 HotDog domain-containing protein [Dunaliella salina]